MQKIFRMLQVLTLALFAGGAAQAQVTTLTPDVAREKALAGEIVIVDIRRPEEWAQTGVPDVAVLADMTQRDFLAKLTAIRLERPDVPLAFICRTGNRSGYVSSELVKMGWTGIYDVVGGMAGSRVDKGWLKRKLPTRAANEPINPDAGVTQP